MCRILVAVARQEGIRFLQSLIRLHALATKSDPYLAKLTRGDGRHCHGYGYLLLADYGSGWAIHYHKHDAADLLGEGEESCKANLSHVEEESRRLTELLDGAEAAVLLLHSRKASRNTPRGTLHAHPYNAGIPGISGYGEVYLAHNGSVHPEPLARKLGVDPSRYTDSHLLTLWLAQQLSRGVGLRDALAGATEFTRTALVAGAIYVAGKNVEAAIISHLSPDLTSERMEYYTPYLVEAVGLKALASPTIIDLAVRQGLEFEASRFQGTKILYQGGPRSWSATPFGRVD